jgi:ELWxxDGT repeat protein
MRKPAWSRAFLLALIGSLLPVSLFAGTPYLVKDINPTAADSNPSDLTPFRNGILFTATTEHQDLWFSDGTEAGTKKLLDLQDADGMARCGEHAFFAHTTPETGSRLWMTDGTPAGTTMVDGSPKGVSPGGIVCIDGTVLFYGGLDVTEPALWRSDGTAGGTLRVTSAADDSFPYTFDQFQSPVRFRHRLYSALYNQDRARLWRSDGTSAGMLIKEFPDRTRITQMKVAGTFLYVVTAADFPDRYTLWRSDGTTEGTVAIREATSRISLMADFYGRLTYSLTDASCTTDGTNEGTCFQPAPATSGNAFAAMPMNGRLYYGRGDLRSTDGISEVATGIERLEKLLTTAGGRLYAFARENLSIDLLLLETGGTLAGSRTFPLPIGYSSTAVASGGRIFVGAGELYALDSDVTATSFSPGSVTVPGGATVTIAGRGFSGPVTIRVGGVLATPGAVTPTSIDFTAPPLEPGFHDIDLTLGDGSRMTLAEPLRYVCSGPTAVITDPPSAVCPLTPVQLHGSGGTRCAWFPPDGLDDPSSCNPTATVFTTTRYTLIASTEAGCDSTNYPTVTVSILPIGSATITLGGQPEPNQPSTASVPDAGAGATYAWTIEGGTIDSGAAMRTVTYRTSCAAVTRLHVTVVVGGCPNTGSWSIASPEPILDSVRPDPANPGSVITVTGRHLSCIDELQLRTDSGSWVRPVPFTVTGNSTLQFRNPPDTPRFLRASASTPALAYFVGTPLYRRSSRHDFNGDVRTDIFWHNASTGQTSIWRMNYDTFTGLVSPSAPPPWVPVAFGDFNDDAMADILWMHPTTGETSIWLMNGTVVTTAVRSTRVPAAWKPAGTGDFDGNGRADIFWHNPTTGETSIWFMNGTAITAVRAMTVPNTWKPLAFGDFNADGKGDIFWRNPASGETSIWLMNGGTPSTTVRSETMAAAWQIGGSGDFNADHKDDLFWFNPTTGETRFWYMDGIAISAKVDMPTMPAGWMPAQAGHFYLDDKADIFWYNAVTGDTQVWMLLTSPTAPFQIFPMLRVTNLNWKPVSAP